MHHPGPPRFVAVGEGVELAPRDPVPGAAYDWTLAAAPAGATATVGDAPVQTFVPDAPGRYRFVLSAPDGEHRLTVRAFGADGVDATGGDAADGPAGRSGAGRNGPDDGGLATTRRPDATTPDADVADEPGATDDRRPDAGPAGVSYAGGLRWGAGTGGGGADGGGGGTGDGTDGATDRDTGGGRPRIRLEATVEADAVVLTADPRPHPGAETPASALDVVFELDDRDALPRSAVTVEAGQLRVPRDALPERVRVHAVAVGPSGFSVPDAVSVERTGDGPADGSAHGPGDRRTRSADAGPSDGRDDEVAVRHLHDPPAWATDAVYYEVYVRTFAPGAAEGERLRAITERLDHLADLGVDAVWLTPVLACDSAPHGYNITDFFGIADDLGSRADLEALVERAHEHDMRVLFDLVLNHSAREHPHFRAATSDPDGEYRDWYEWQDSGEPGTYFDWERIANFDFAELAVRRHLLDAVDEWAPLVDGFRCDMAWAVPRSFWMELRDRVKAREPGFLLLDETIPYIADFQGGLFDVHFDSTTYAALRSVGTGWAPASALLDAVAERRAVGFPDHAAFLLYAENHDETRYVVECGRAAAMAAAGALCTLPGAPLVYAGQELGQLGRRDDVVWETTDEGLTEQYRRVLAARRELPALAADAALERIDWRVAEGDPDRVLAFGRAARDGGPAAGGPGETSETGAVSGGPGTGAAVVVCHFGEGAATVRVGPDVGPTDLVSGERVLDADGAVRVEDVVVLPVSGALAAVTGGD